MLDDRALLAEIVRAPGLERARRLSWGAVLPGRQLDLCGLGAEVVRVIEGLGAEADLRGLWLADDELEAAAADALVGLMARHPGLEVLDVSGNALAGAGLGRLMPALAGHRGLRTLMVADNGIDACSLARLARALEPTGVLHVVLGRRGGSRANAWDVGTTGAWAAALGRFPAWATLDMRGMEISASELERLRSVLSSNANVGRWMVDAELGPELVARLCHQANLRRAPPMPELARLRRALPVATEKDVPLPAAWAEHEEDLAAAMRLLGRLAKQPELILGEHPRVAALRRGVALVLREQRREQRRVSASARASASLNQRREEDRRRTEDAGIRQRRGGTAPTPPGQREAGETIHELHASRRCYVCKENYKRLHFFYDRLCPDCAAVSYVRRMERVDLTGCQAIVTGGRIKIGHEVALRLLRWGARVLVTSRFPRDTIRRFAGQPDFSEFSERLQVHALDLRSVPDVEVFARHVVHTYSRVDILINNAAQTVRRPQAFFAALAAEEARPLAPGLDSLLVAPQEQAAGEAVPALVRDEFGEPLDTRAGNSWRMRLGEVGTVELLEVQLINVVAPFLLNARLRPAMARRGPGEASFIINVSAPEGRFDRIYKSPYHPHTNMAKAALNMMTRTSADEYAEEGIFMTSVDPGWASNENPEPVAAAMRARGFMPPLDLIDAAARVCDPVARGRRDGELLRGVFIKDFKEISW